MTGVRVIGLRFFPSNLSLTTYVCIALVSGSGVGSQRFLFMWRLLCGGVNCGEKWAGFQVEYRDLYVVETQALFLALRDHTTTVADPGSLEDMCVCGRGVWFTWIRGDVNINWQQPPYSAASCSQLI